MHMSTIIFRASFLKFNTLPNVNTCSMRDRDVLVTAALAGCVVSYLVCSLRARRKPNCILDGYVGLVGNTPMIRIKSLSDATGCEILAKV
jgi:hypothetical protein